MHTMLQERTTKHEARRTMETMPCGILLGRVRLSTPRYCMQTITDTALVPNGHQHFLSVLTPVLVLQYNYIRVQLDNTTSTVVLSTALQLYYV
jgi:hypothetical protein